MVTEASRVGVVFACLILFLIQFMTACVSEDGEKEGMALKGKDIDEKWIGEWIPQEPHDDVSPIVINKKIIIRLVKLTPTRIVFTKRSGPAGEMEFDYTLLENDLLVATGTLGDTTAAELVPKVFYKKKSE